MKNLIFVICILTLASCSKKGDPTPANGDLQKLNGAWVIKTITRDGVDMSSFYTNFQITFTGTDYAIIHRPNPTPFLPNGPISVDDVNKVLAMNSGTDLLNLHYDFPADKEMHVTFFFSGTGYPGGRVTGNWDVDLVKK